MKRLVFCTVIALALLVVGGTLGCTGSAPTTAAEHNEQGITLTNEGKYNEAIAEFSKAIELDQNFTEAYSGRGMAYRKNGQNDLAIVDYNKAIELDPKYAIAYNNRGVAYYSKGQNDLAIADYNRAIELDPKYAQAYDNRGVAYYSKGQNDLAIVDYNKAIELSKDANLTQQATENLAKLGQSPATNVTPAPPPPPQAMLQLAFAGDRNGRYALFVINIDGSGEKQITSLTDDDYTHPSWSPDGTLIAAETSRGISRGIVTMSLNDGTVRQLFQIGVGHFVVSSPDYSSPYPFVLGPDFSPYGNLIICSGRYALTTVNLGGVAGSISVSQPGKLGNNDMMLAVSINTLVGGKYFAGSPSVSPDANKIAFEGLCEVRKPPPTPTISPPTDSRGGSPVFGYLWTAEHGKRICVVDFDGTNLKQLTTGEDRYDDTYPTWSPDGQRIAFMSNRTTGKNQIYVMNADGTGQTQITSATFNNHDPAWSPDGAYIAYVADYSGISELCIIRPDGTERKQINKVAEMVKNPAWRPLAGK